MLDLVECNRLGLIPGPNEDVVSFNERVKFCLSLKTDLLAEVTLPGSEMADSQILEPAYHLTKTLYDINPDWVPVFFSNWKLAPWHGGAAWIFQLNETSPLGALLQLRKALYKQAKYLGIYSREELIAHEMAHVGRMAFEEKKYEELLAYRTSKSGFTRYFSPIIQSALESRLIIYLIATLLMMDAFFLMQGSLQAYLDTQVFKLLPLMLVVWALFRLKKRQDTLAGVEQKLKEITEHSSAVLYRLTDEEIESFRHKTKVELQDYIEKEPSLRWQVIRLSYF